MIQLQQAQQVQQAAEQEKYLQNCLSAAEKVAGDIATKWEMGRALGEGAYGTVNECWPKRGDGKKPNQVTNTVKVIKKMQKTATANKTQAVALREAQEQVKEFQQEVACLKKVHGQAGFVQIAKAAGQFQVFESPTAFYFVTDIMQGGNFQPDGREAWSRASAAIKKAKGVRLVHQLLHLAGRLHTEFDMVHGDLQNARNVMLTVAPASGANAVEPDVVIIDFGKAKKASAQGVVEDLNDLSTFMEQISPGWAAYGDYEGDDQYVFFTNGKLQQLYLALKHAALPDDEDADPRPAAVPAVVTIAQAIKVGTDSGLFPDAAPQALASYVVREPVLFAAGYDRSARYEHGGEEEEEEGRGVREAKLRRVAATNKRLLQERRRLRRQVRRVRGLLDEARAVLRRE